MPEPRTLLVHSHLTLTDAEATELDAAYAKGPAATARTTDAVVTAARQRLEVVDAEEI